jgi:hypothetical protein
MIELIFIVLFWIITIAVSMQFGAELVADDLHRVNRINNLEYENFISWKYLIEKIRDEIQN